MIVLYDRLDHTLSLAPSIEMRSVGRPGGNA
jgi:hypothetical protein